MGLFDFLNDPALWWLYDPRILRIVSIVTLIEVLALFIVIMITRYRHRKKGAYVYEIIIKKKGKNDHLYHRCNKLDFKYKHEGQKYNIKTDNLYQVKRGRFKKSMDNTFHIKNRFMVVFNENKPDAVAFSEPDTTPQVLMEVSQSSALKKALSDEFKQAFSMKWLFVIFMILVAVVLAYFFMSGQLMF